MFAMSNPDHNDAMSSTNSTGIDGGLSTVGAHPHENADALSTTKDASKYERAMYALVSGHYKGLAATQVCTTWEDRCWSMYSCMKQRLEDK